MTDRPPPVEATPALVIDLPTVERNIGAMADYARSHRLRLRPHTKTHKSIRMARLQLAAGAEGLAVAKAGEAEIMAQASDDVLVAYPAIDPHRAARLADLARRATVRVAVDSARGVENLAWAARAASTVLGLLVDLDVGFHRTGVQSPHDALALAQLVARHPSLRLDGLFFYPGHVGPPADTQPESLAAVDALLDETLALWRRAGLQAPILSGGSTPSARQSHTLRHQTEIRPGTYIYNDMNTVRAGFCTLDDCAARIVCTVVSDAVPGKVVIDAGSKTLTSDRNGAATDSGFGHVVEYPSAKIIRLTEEHGEIDTAACARRPKPGDRLTVIPNHICPCINLQDAVWLRREDGSLESLPIDARGKLS